MELMKGMRHGTVHIQRSSDIPICGRRMVHTMPVSPSEEVTCKICLKVHKLLTEAPQEKTCTICGHTKDIDDFYYNSALDALASHCKGCSSKLQVMKKRYKAEGKHLTVKEFREKRLYERMVVKTGYVPGGRLYEIKELETCHQ